MAHDKIVEFINNKLMETIKDELKNAKSEEEADEIIKKADEIDIENLYLETISITSENMINHMKDTMYEEVMLFRANEQEFLARQEQKWYKAFVASEAMYMMILESAESYTKYVSSLDDDIKNQKCYTYTAMVHIHGRALQQYLEIITLMKNGFADGAYSRWRSMYELAVIASFITEQGENVAEAFINSYDTEDSYNWAKSSGIFPKDMKYITFNAIQRSCNLNTESWKDQYKLANKTIHASSQGTFARLCNMKDTDIVPTGRSDYGLTTPGEHSAIALAQITTMFFTLFPNSDSLISIKCIDKWVDIIREIYFKTHDDVFPDAEPLWSDELLNSGE